MRPAWSVVWFTTLVGTAQGLVVALATLRLLGHAPQPPVLAALLALALLLGLVALAASFAHLGRPERAWRAAAMWRTSWLSREVLAVPLFLLLTALSLLAVWRLGQWPLVLTGLTVAAALALWLCTGRVYAAIAFIREWATPLTPLNFALMGLASGHLLAAAALALSGAGADAALAAHLALGWTLLAWIGRAAALARLATVRPAGSLQTAIGVPSASIRQVSRGFTAGSFNLHEFRLQLAPHLMPRLRRFYMLAAFVLPVAVLALLWLAGASEAAVDTSVWVVLALLQFVALLAERWDFFAQVDHPQNRYYAAAQ